jgi:membrane-bound lytic murein transglycosylase D
MKWALIPALLALPMLFTTSVFDLRGIYRVADVPEEVEEDVKELAPSPSGFVDKYLSDYKGVIPEEFKLSEFYYPNVRFWFLIYTWFEPTQVVVHDKDNLDLVYKILDFSPLYQKELNRNTLYVVQQNITKEKVRILRQDLDFLIRSPFSQEDQVRPVLNALELAGVELPEERIPRIKLLKSLRRNLRTQIGQKSFIREGLQRSLPYQHFIRNHFLARGLPADLIAVPFLESSFNPQAQSKVSALGAWQFMPFIASHFMPARTSELDYRYNIGVSSVAAAHLMAENYRILKSWDLTVTAYNSGPKHLLATKRELASRDVDLEAVIKNSDSQRFGFASKNFYSEFLALVHTLAYQQELFDSIPQTDRPSDDLIFHVSKCPLVLNKALEPDLLREVTEFNHQLRDLNRRYPKGLIVTTKSRLPAGKFLALTEKQILKIKPKSWPALTDNQSCSTK